MKKNFEKVNRTTFVQNLLTMTTAWQSKRKCLTAKFSLIFFVLPNYVMITICVINKVKKQLK